MELFFAFFFPVSLLSLRRGCVFLEDQRVPLLGDQIIPSFVSLAGQSSAILLLKEGGVKEARELLRPASDW
jgi:hypothetical protein